VGCFLLDFLRLLVVVWIDFFRFWCKNQHQELKAKRPRGGERWQGSVCASTYIDLQDDYTQNLASVTSINF
jgi:hypothetical protein